jgi:hypothetical protein
MANEGFMTLSCPKGKKSYKAAILDYLPGCTADSKLDE